LAIVFRGKNGNIVTEYSLLFLFFTFWRNLAIVFRGENGNIVTEYSLFIFYFFHILAKFRAKKKTLRFSVPSFQHPVE
jgi:hypothetical protein